MFPTTIHEIHTTECIKPQQAAKNTVSASGFKWFDITCVADRKNNLLQYHENTRVKTGAKTVTMNLLTPSSILQGGSGTEFTSGYLALLLCWRQIYFLANVQQKPNLSHLTP